MPNKTVRMNFTVPKGTKARWKLHAKAEGVSLSEPIHRATSDDQLSAVEKRPQ